MSESPLNLSKKGFDEIPLQSITPDTSWIILSYNNIKHIPKEITKINKLEKLALNDNRIEKVTDALNELKHLNWLDLTRNELTTLPSNLFLINLVGLGLSENDFNEIPSCVYKFLRLRKFGFFYNKIRTVSPNIQFLINLIKLDLSNNFIEELPNEICNLRNLNWLNLSNNKLKKLPDEFGKLSKLQELGLGRNFLESLPNLNQLSQLKVLSAYRNKLTKFNVNSFSIKKIDLANNLLTLFPNCIFQIFDLEVLNLKKNKIKKIKLKKIQLNYIFCLDLSNNKLRNIPFKFLKTFENCRLLNLDFNPFKKSRDYFPRVPSLELICQSRCYSMGIFTDTQIKEEYMCDFCNSVFIHKPILIYSGTLRDNSHDAYVMREEICKTRCYVMSLRFKNEYKYSESER